MEINKLVTLSNVEIENKILNFEELNIAKHYAGLMYFILLERKYSISNRIKRKLRDIYLDENTAFSIDEIRSFF